MAYLHCVVCHKGFHARRDARFCRPKCRQRERQENAQFQMPKIPKSGVVGVTYKRIIQRWVVSVKLEKGKNWKYVGAFKSVKRAVEFQKEVLNRE